MSIINPTPIPGYTYISKLGQGVYGSVFKYVRITDTSLVAIKKYKNENKFKKSTQKELDILETLKNKKENHIIDFYGVIELNGYKHVVLEYFKNDLYHFIKLNTLNFENTLKILKKILIGLDYLHKNDIIHCDLKPENVVYNENTGDLRIIDFGCAIHKSDKTKSFYVQSRYYRAIEILFYLNYNNKIDIWSFACLAFELLLFRPLFPAKNQHMLVSMVCDELSLPPEEYIKSKQFENYYTNVDGNIDLIYKHNENINIHIEGLDTSLRMSIEKKYKSSSLERVNNFIDMIKSIIRYDYNNRPSCEELLNLELFENIN